MVLFCHTGREESVRGEEYITSIFFVVVVAVVLFVNITIQNDFTFKNA